MIREHSEIFCTHRGHIKVKMSVKEDIFLSDKPKISNSCLDGLWKRCENAKAK